MHPLRTETSQAELHPRPQMARSAWVDLNGLWQFAYDPEDQGIAEGWVNRSDVFVDRIRVPIPPEAPASGIRRGEPCSVMWYRRLLDLSGLDADRLLLHFGAVDFKADVWLNGQHVATHEGGYTPFAADISHVDRKDGQVLVVRVLDDPNDLSQPRGKQFWESRPRGIWQSRTSGIWQQVWLEPLPASHLTEVRWTPKTSQQALALEVLIDAADHTSLLLRIQLEVHGECIADDVVAVTQPVVTRQIPIPAEWTSATTPSRYSWSPEHPNLVQAVLTLFRGDTELDRVFSYAGYRTLKVTRGRFVLNGEPYFLRLVLSHGFWPSTHLAAPSVDALRTEARLIQDLGFNGVRLHQKVEDPRFLQICDEIGLLVVSEMPAAYSYTATGVTRYIRQWSEVIRRDYSHPSIVSWVPFNESWGLPQLADCSQQQSFLRSIYHLTHALDGTRPVITDSGRVQSVTDIVAIHDYTKDPALLDYRYADGDALSRTLQEEIRTVGSSAPDLAVPVILNECGGASLPPACDRPVYGYGRVDTPKQLLAVYSELVDAIMHSTVLAGFCYTQLADVECETNGLLRADRAPKVDPALVRDVTQRPSAASSSEVLLALIREAAERRAVGK